MWILKAVDFRWGLKCNWILEVAEVDRFQIRPMWPILSSRTDCTTVLLFLMDQSQFFDQ